ncbi:MAG: hypothetical protein V7765_07785 [Oleispira sp.]
MNQDTYDQWLKDSLFLLIEAESKDDEDFTRITIEVILKQTSLAIKHSLTIPPDLINYLVGRFDCYFDDLVEASKNTKNEVTAIPEKLAEVLHLKNKRPKDHVDTSMRLSILSRAFCDAFYEAQASEEKSDLRPENRPSRITPPLRLEIEKSFDYRESFFKEGFILGSGTKKKITTEDIKHAFMDIMGIPEGTAKSYGTKYKLYRFKAKPKEIP